MNRKLKRARWRDTYYGKHGRDPLYYIEFEDYPGREKQIAPPSMWCEFCGGNIHHGEHGLYFSASANEPESFECFTDEEIPF